MITLLLLAVGLGQVHAVAAAWCGGWLPDPFVVLAAFAGLYLPRSELLGAALVLGLARSCVTLESAGGHVLCAWLALALLASQRDGFERERGPGLVIAALVTALCLLLGALLLRASFGTPLTAGWPLITGALLLFPCASLVRRAGRRWRVAT